MLRGLLTFQFADIGRGCLLSPVFETSSRYHVVGEVSSVALIIVVDVNVFVLRTLDHIRKQSCHAIILTLVLSVLVTCHHVTDLFATLSNVLVVSVYVLRMHAVASCVAVASSNLLFNELVVDVQTQSPLPWHKSVVMVVMQMSLMHLHRVPTSGVLAILWVLALRPLGVHRGTSELRRSTVPVVHVFEALPCSWVLAKHRTTPIVVVMVMGWTMIVSHLVMVGVGGKSILMRLHVTVVLLTLLVHDVVVTAILIKPMSTV